MQNRSFDDCNFHDNHIHGLSYSDENFENDFYLDLDYILEWHCDNDSYKFLVAPASLKFSSVSSYKIEVTKECKTLNSYISIIMDIETTKLESGLIKYEFKLVGDDKITIFAESAELEIRGAGLLVKDQHLTNEQRSAV